jgi:hypothetical protein
LSDETYELVRHAILTKQHISAYYHGHYREMCPHVLGTKNGRRQALCYQFGGSSSSGLAPAGSTANWRCVIIDQLQDVAVSAGDSWHTAPNHSRPQTCVDYIDVEVEF